MTYTLWMHNFVTIGDLLVNLSNVVAFDVDGALVKRIWYTGSPTPVEVQGQVAANGLLTFLQAKGFLA